MSVSATRVRSAIGNVVRPIKVGFYDFVESFCIDGIMRWLKRFNLIFTRNEQPNPSFTVTSKFISYEVEVFDNASTKNSLKKTIVAPSLIIDTLLSEDSKTLLLEHSVREAPAAWNAISYISVAPMILEIRNAIVHSSAGIICFSDRFLASTLWHTDPNNHRYRTLEDGIEIIYDDIQHLSGNHISILAGSCHNYYHSMIDSVARLSTLTELQMNSADSLLIPSGGCKLKEFISLYPLPSSLEIRHVSINETFLLDKVWYPSTLNGLCCYHPTVLQAFDAVSERLPISHTARPKRLYIDRRRSSSRKLLNEDEVILYLNQYGFVSVCLEDMSLQEQVYLFREAEFIVAPHGAGLTNIVFCNKSCFVIEFLIDAYLHEGFRRLAAIRGIEYRFLIGQAEQPWPPLGIAIHGLTWRVCLQDVKIAVEWALSNSQRTH